MEAVGGGDGILDGADRNVGEQLRLELVGSEDRRFRHHLITVDGHQLRGDIQLPMVAHHRVAHVDSIGVDGADLVERAEHRAEQVRRPHVPGEEVRVLHQVIGLEALNEIPEVVPIHHLRTPRPRRVSCVVGELHRVDDVNVHPERLQREHRALVPDIPVDSVRLDRKDARVFRLDRRGAMGRHPEAASNEDEARGQLRERRERSVLGS
mmetsp:Transcript_55849/g.132537  ORF Transcript_55849/g.132537 Transcript_55849/m.132537 type:complete len:209 (-) Transcript_55849:9-635(-)